MANLKTITTRGGARFTVDADSAPRFETLLNGLEAAGYPIKGDQSGGYNPRNIAGTNTPSLHSYGRAVDVNWTDNPRGRPGQIPADLARRLAAESGMTWGGDWKNPDPMHFEVANGRPMQERGLTSVAGMAPPVNAAQNGGISGGQAQPSPATAAPTQSPDLSSLIAQMFSGASGAPAAPQQGGAAGMLASLTPQETGKPESPYPTLSNTEMPALPQSMRRPVDLGRLREVLASRARLGTA